MKKKFKAKVSGMFDIVQLGDDTFSEVVDKLKANDYHIDQQFTNREECYIEAIGDSGTKSVSRGDMVFTDETGELFIMSEKRFNATYEDVQRLIETIRYNTGTLEQLRREYSMMRKDSQSTR